MHTPSTPPYARAVSAPDPGTPPTRPAAGGPGRPPSPGLKLLVEAGPLGVFFLVNARSDIYAATGAFMAAVVVALAANWWLERRLPVLPLVTAVFVLVFGGLTLALEDEVFIKLKPTLVNVLFAALLLGGLAFRRSFLKTVLGPAFRLEEGAWRALTVRWAAFFLFLAATNEVVWRNLSTDAWVRFKVFGILPLTLVFVMTQMPFIQRHQLPEDPPEPGGPGARP